MLILKKRGRGFDVNNFENSNVEELDVRGILKQNKDPFNLIMDSLENF